MKPKIKKIGKFLNFFLAKSVTAVTLAPFGIYMREEYMDNVEILNHEKIHWAQQLEMLIIFFYFWYIIEWTIRYIFINGNLAYMTLSLEREAYGNEYNLSYLLTRKHFIWLKYFKSHQ